ncbi:MAG: hypothetical protein ACI4Q3_06905 [Kiritimatiellia bacterium]
MQIGLGDLALVLFLAGVSSLAWRRRRNVGGKTWAFRIAPLAGVACAVAACVAPGLGWAWHLALCAAGLVVCGVAAFRGGWRVSRPRNAVGRWTHWAVSIAGYFVFAALVTIPPALVLCFAVRLSCALEGDWPWTRGRIAGDLPFAVEYRRAKTLCAEHDKRLLFKSGKRVGLLGNPGGFGPFRVYRLKDGCHALVDGFGHESVPGFEPRVFRVNAARETVELKFGGGWFEMPGAGLAAGYGGDDMNGRTCSFFMYDNTCSPRREWNVEVVGTPVADSLDGMELIGEIDTAGRFTRNGAD